MRRKQFILVLCGLLLAMGRGGAAEFESGKSYFGQDHFIEYVVGDLPLIITSPHGGHEKPDSFPDRTRGVVETDRNTRELARAIAAEVYTRTGRHPHLVICHLARKKLDCNREIAEAAASHPAGERAWQEYHAFIEKASAAAAAQSGKGFLIDIHGQGHRDQRIELGYLHPIETLALPDAELNAPKNAAAGSLRLVAAHSPLPYAELVRGPRSLGARLEAAGYPAAPSPDRPAPVLPFFIGGYTVARHAGKSASVAGLQLEANYKGVRDTAESREKFARALVSALQEFLREQYGLELGDVAKGL